ncbi:MAG: hypothetical protein AAF456_05690 [Planctomycetota bacterium]
MKLKTSAIAMLAVLTLCGAASAQTGIFSSADLYLDYRVMIQERSVGGYVMKYDTHQPITNTSQINVMHKAFVDAAAANAWWAQVPSEYELLDSGWCSLPDRPWRSVASVTTYDAAERKLAELRIENGYDFNITIEPFYNPPWTTGNHTIWLPGGRP